MKYIWCLVDVYILYSGPSRKLLGLTFQGESHDTDGMIWVDVEINGLTNDVRLLFTTT